MSAASISVWIEPVLGFLLDPWHLLTIASAIGLAFAIRFLVQEFKAMERSSENRCDLRPPDDST